MNNSNILKSLEWQGNSKKMYELTMSSIPSIFMGKVKNSIINWITKNDIHIVTEELFFKAIDDIAPTNIANKIKSQLNKIKSE